VSGVVALWQSRHARSIYECRPGTLTDQHWREWHSLVDVVIAFLAGGWGILVMTLATLAAIWRSPSRTRKTAVMPVHRTKESNAVCGFSALERSVRSRSSLGHDKGVFFMKQLALATAAVLALLSIVGCANTGKGKAPPPVVTKG
jgi:hypothetical protein